jgi:hypothetical protein
MKASKRTAESVRAGSTVGTSGTDATNASAAGTDKFPYLPFHRAIWMELERDDGLVILGKGMGMY